MTKIEYNEIQYNHNGVVDFFIDEEDFTVKDRSRYETRRRKAQEKERKMWRKKKH